MSDRDADDDPQLESLRAVWLAMPEEDPPERGLAELMAAARVKASEMATPSLWQRMLATLRRPSVLAFATVLVLLGGAVFIGQRGDEMQAEPPSLRAEQDRTLERAQEVAPPVAAGPAAAGSAAAPSAPVEEKAAEGVDTLRAEPPKLATPEKAPVNRRAPAKSSTTTAKSPTATAKSSTVTAKPSAPKPSAPKPPEKFQLEDRNSGAADRDSRSFESEIVVGGAATSGDSAAAGRAPAPAPAPVMESAPRGGVAAQTPTESTASQPSRTAQYLAQAKSAAARGDCAAARVLMKRVASEDAPTYRKALASDATLHKCVVVAQ